MITIVLVSGIALAIAFWVTVISIAYKIYSRRIKRQKEAGIASIATLRPTGIVLYSWFLWAGCVFTIIQPLLSLQTHKPVQISFFAIILGILNGIAGWGLWKLEKWGYWLAIGLIIVAFFNCIRNSISIHTPFVIISSIIVAIFYLFLLLYLTRNRTVRALFGLKIKM